MRRKSTVAALTLALRATAGVDEAAAQGLETTGNRAAAMAAFVAVADDASAVVWNPAGLVAGPILNISLDLGQSTDAPDGVPVPPASGQRVGTMLLAAGVPPLGLSYYRLNTTTAQTAGPAVSETPGRENSEVIVRTLVTSHLGATVLQSLGNYLTVGATAKLVRGRIGAAIATDVESWDEAFDRADTIDTDGSTAGDVDVGAMLAAGRVRAGVVVRNVTEPSFDADGRGPAVTLERYARAGFAWGDRWPGMAMTIVAFDAELTRVTDVTGERRDVAVGAERWLRNRRIGVRGGMRASTFGELRPVGSAGISYGVRAGTFVDAFIARGTDEQRGWGIGVRLTY